MTNSLPRYNDPQGRIIQYRVGDIVPCFSDENGEHLYVIKNIDGGQTRGHNLPYDDNKTYDFEYYDRILKVN